MNYRQIPNALGQRRSFKYTTMSAKNSGGVYTVWSYALPIYKVNLYTGEILEDQLDLNWSQTTRRHQNLVKNNLANIYGRLEKS